MLLNAVTVLTALGVAAAQGLGLARMDLSREQQVFGSIFFFHLSFFSDAVLRLRGSRTQEFQVWFCFFLEVVFLFILLFLL